MIHLNAEDGTDQSITYDLEGWDILLGAGDDPIVAISDSCRLQATDVAPGKRLADRQCDELLAGEHFGHNLRLQFGCPIVEDRREADDSSSQQRIDETTRTKPSQLGVDDKLCDVGM